MRFKSKALLLSSFVSMAVGPLASAQTDAQRADDTAPPAEQSATAALEEIIVTATKRAESIQHVPMSITALTSQTLEARAIKSFVDYGSSIPNLSFAMGAGGAADGVGAARSIAIRGISGDGTTGFYLDDTPLTASIDPHVLDMQRIEVLRGPQGTLYGARSMGGTVRLVSTPPDVSSFSAATHAGISSTGQTDTPNTLADATVNMPLIPDRLALRAQAYYAYEAGFITRSSIAAPGTPSVAAFSPTPFLHHNVGRTDTRGGSLSLLWQVSDALSITPRLLYQRNTYNGFPFADLNYDPAGPAPTMRPRRFTQQRLFDLAEEGTDAWSLGSLTVKYQTAYGELVSSSSYFTRNTDEKEDVSEFIYQIFTQPFGAAPLPASVVEQKRMHRYVEELRFASMLSGPVQFVAGGYFSSTYGNFGPGNYLPQIVPGLDAASGGVLGSDLVVALTNDQRINEPALFGEVSWNVTDELKLTGGMRAYRVRTTSETSLDGLAYGGGAFYPSSTITEDGINPKYEVSYQLSPDHMVYALASKGFRPGGLQIPVPDSGGLSCVDDLQQIGLTPEDTRSFKSDSLWNYEVGTKNSWDGNRVVLNGSAYYIKWSNIVQNVLLPCGQPFIANAAAAKSEGAELELLWRPVRGLELSAGAGYQHAVITEQSSGAGALSPQLPGSPIYMVPEWTINAATAYTHQLTPGSTLTYNLTYSYVSDRKSANNNSFDPRVVPAYGLLDANLALKWDRYELLLIGKNLTDAIASYGDTRSIGAELAGRPRIAVNRPRTIGLELRTEF